MRFDIEEESFCETLLQKINNVDENKIDSLSAFSIFAPDSMKNRSNIFDNMYNMTFHISGYEAISELISECVKKFDVV